MNLRHLITSGELEVHEPNSSSPLVITSSRVQWNAALATLSFITWPTNRQTDRQTDRQQVLTAHHTEKIFSAEECNSRSLCLQQLKPTSSFPDSKLLISKPLCQTMAVTSTSDLLTSKSKQFIFVPNCTWAANMMKFSRAVLRHCANKFDDTQMYRRTTTIHNAFGDQLTYKFSISPHKINN